MGIMMAAFASMTANQSRETTALSQKLASTDFQQLLVSSLASGSVCTYLMTLPGTTPIGIASLVGATTPQMISVPLTGTPRAATLYASVNTSVTPNVPGPVIAQVNQAPSAYSSSLVVNKIQLAVNPLSAAPTSYPATLTANWIVSFDSTKLVRALLPAATATTLTVNSAGAVTGCQNAASASSSTPGTPCTSASYPGNRGVVMYEDHAEGGVIGQFCCGFVNGNNFNTGFSYGVQCDRM